MIRPSRPARPALLAGLAGLLLAPGCAGRDAPFPDLLPRPHETPRRIDETASAPAGLSEAERTALQGELRRLEAACARLRETRAAASRALEAALARARGAPAGSDVWADAQLLLSRLDQARAGYGEIEAALAPLARLVDPAPADDPDRVQLEQFRAAVRAEADALAATVEQASRRLG